MNFVCIRWIKKKSCVDRHGSYRFFQNGTIWTWGQTLTNVCKIIVETTNTFIIVLVWFVSLAMFFLTTLKKPFMFLVISCSKELFSFTCFARRLVLFNNLRCFEYLRHFFLLVVQNFAYIFWRLLIQFLHVLISNFPKHVFPPGEM